MKPLLAGLLLLGLSGCGELHPSHGTGASDVPVTDGGFGGPQEGSPGNATNLGSDASTIFNGSGHARH